jgi:hypothetical protein
MMDNDLAIQKKVKKGDVYRQLKKDSDIWLPLFSEHRCFLRYSSVFQWHAIDFTESGEIDKIRFWDERRAQNEMDNLLAEFPNERCESVPLNDLEVLQKIAGDMIAAIDKLKKENLTHLHSLKGDEMELRLSFGSHYFHIFWVRDHIQRFYELDELLFMEDLAFLIIKKRDLMYKQLPPNIEKIVYKKVFNPILLQDLKDGRVEIGGGYTTESRWILSNKNGVLVLGSPSSSTSRIISDARAKEIIKDHLYQWIHEIRAE